MAKQPQTPQKETNPPPFFTLNNLTPHDHHTCILFTKTLYPSQKITPSPTQGSCSFTLLVGSAIVIQFRPPSYRLDTSITSLASSLYPFFAPETVHLATLLPSGLGVYSMRRIPGISLLEFRARARESLYLERLVISLANFLAHAYHSPPPPPLPLGKIGRSLASRLKLLATNLPSRFRPRARYLLDNLEVVTTLPWVLTHGDLVPGNMMVDASSGRLTGLVDWAEAEVLPFGVCFYGVEEVLGGMTEGGWRWWNEVEVERLRGLFWRELGVGEEVRGRVEMARDVGVLLWWGIAWDDGRLDRVVEEGRDDVEIARLDAFLGPFGKGGEKGAML